MKNSSRGLTLIELLIYAAVSSFVLIAVIAAVQFSYRFYTGLTVTARVDRVGISIAETIVRSIRTGNDIVLEESEFGVPLGSLSVLVPEAGGATTITKHLSVEDGAVLYSEDGGTSESLTPTDVTVSRFLLNHINTAVSEAVHFELELTYQEGGEAHTREYSGVAILRRSYE